MQFQIPQFIETEDKIVGPFTLKQFGYVGGAAGVSFLLYNLLPQPLWFLLSLIIVGAGVAFAFVKINGQPFSRIAVSALSYYWKPQTYVWQPDNPKLAKSESAFEGSEGKSALHEIVAGFALKNAWRTVQTGTQASVEKSRVAFGRMKERYEVIQRISGERQAARRIDYR